MHFALMCIDKFHFDDCQILDQSELILLEISDSDSEVIGYWSSYYLTQPISYQNIA